MTAPSALQAADQLLRSQNVAREIQPLLDGVWSGALHVDALNVEQLMRAVQYCRDTRSSAQRALARMPAANDAAGPPAPRAA